LEGEYNSLQRRLKDQETKLANHDRTMATVRQTLTQSQQRAVEWEKRAKETDTEINGIRSQLEEASDANTRLESEVFLLKAQLQEKEADERLAQDREGKLRDQVAALEGQVARLKTEGSKPPIASTVYVESASNGVWNSMHHPYRANGVDIRCPSPAASVASTAPTLDDNGWWS